MKKENTLIRWHFPCHHILRKMNLDYLLQQPSPIPLHAITALLAIGVGGWQLVATKGTRQHKTIGYAWVSLMLIVSISSFWISTIKQFGDFSLIHLLSIFTLWSLYTAISAVRQNNIKKHKVMMILLYVLALILTGAFTLLPGRVMHEVFF